MSLSEWLLIAAVFFAPLFVGTVHEVAMWTIAALVLGAFWTTRRSASRTISSNVVFFFGLAWLVATIIQVVPLPQSVVKVLSPVSWDIQTGALAPLGVATLPRWMPLSLEPAATWREIAKLAVLLLVYQVSRVHAANGRLSVATTIAATGVAVSVVSLVHSLLGASTVYGLYEARGVEQHVAPFINGNHQAGFLAMSAAVATGLVLQARDPRGRAIWLSAVAVIVGGAIAAGSRGGTVALALAVVGTIGLRSLRRYPGVRRVPIVIVAILLVVAVIEHETVVRMLSDHNTRKGELWQATPQFLRDFVWTGAGRGALDRKSVV